MRNDIEFLKKDRLVNKAFEKRLEKVGLEIKHKPYFPFGNRPYVQIGRKRVWLIDSDDTDRYQNDVVKEIINVVNQQKKEAEEADALVEDFFKKLGERNDENEN